MKGFFKGANAKKRLAALAVVVLVAAAAVMNWSYNRRWGAADSKLAEAEDAMTAQTETLEAMGLVPQEATETAAVSDYFAEARITRQRSRDSALSLLESAVCAETASQEVIDKAMDDITVMANWSLTESRIENELLAKQFADCVVYLSNDGCTVAVPAAADGLTEAEVARVTEAVLANTDCAASQINVIAVMKP